MSDPPRLVTATTEDLLAREAVAGVRDAGGITLVNGPVTVGVIL
ncbi:hypothetical protein ACI2LJ_30790 [Streptomyces sp. NPDC088090]